MTRQDEESSESPSLLRLAATALAANPPGELKTLQAPLAASPSLVSAASSLRLPLPASQALFDSYRQLPRPEPAREDPITAHQLQPFTDGQAFPLEDLDLQDCYALSDGQLCQLLKAQRRSLRSLNINNCERLTHRLSGRLRSLRLQRLQLLCIGYTKYILGSWFEAPFPAALFTANTGLEDGGAGLDDSFDEDSEAAGCSHMDTAASSAGQDDALRAFVLGLVNEAAGGPPAIPDPGPGPADDPMEVVTEEALDELPGTSAGPSAAPASASAALERVPSQMSLEGLESEAPEDDTMESLEGMSAEESWALKDEMARAPGKFALSKAAKYPGLGQKPAMAAPITAVCPNLQALIVFGFSLEESPELSRHEFVPKLLRNLLAPLEKLLYLDLSYWEGLEDARFLRPLTNRLTALVLYNCPNLYQAVDTIAEVRHLATLDLSQSHKDTGIYPRPVSTLFKLCSSLPHLKHLDISSTNLAADPSKDDWPAGLKEGPTAVRSDIVGLRGLRQRLDFLGLYKCETAARLAHLPAAAVTGDGNEAQVLLALQTYQERQEVLRDVLNEVYTVYRFGGADAAEGVEQRRALALVVRAMRAYLRDATTQIAGSASLFYIIKPVTMTGGERRAVVRTLLAGMEQHMEEQVMVRNCCLSLCQVEIPADVLHDYQRAARLLIAAIKAPNIDEMTQKVVVYLLNSMACHVEGEHKSAVGELGAVEAVLEQIQRRVAENTCDEVMEVAWSFLWNITDETPGNCQRFLARQGLQLFLAAYEKFPQQRELVRNMMGLMGNIAEVEDQRAALRHPQYIRIFVELLDCLAEGIEISYNSAGVLAHVLSDEEWLGESVAEELSRASVGAALVAATHKWKLDQRRYINYRSFGPILRLLRLDSAAVDRVEESASLVWGVWALANLTTVDGNKYCEFVRREGGEALLERIAASRDVGERVRGLADVVRDNMAKWARNELPTHSYDDEPDEAL